MLDTGTVVFLGSAAGGPAGAGPRREVGESPVVALEWVVDSTAGLAGLLEAGAFRIVDLDMSAEEASPVGCSLRWAVTVKLGDVGALPAAALAAGAAGEAAAPVEVRHCLAAAWNRAADPTHHCEGSPTSPGSAER